MQQEMERRKFEDRRKKPTSAWSFYTFFGRRRRFRRKSDQEVGGYTDRYSSAFFFLIVLILGLNILDSVFTMVILDLGGKEFNPLVRAAITLHGDKFWIWKFIIVSSILILLCLHRAYRLIRSVLIAISAGYLLVILYQIFLIFTLRTPGR